MATTEQKQKVRDALVACDYEAWLTMLRWSSAAMLKEDAAFLIDLMSERAVKQFPEQPPIEALQSVMNHLHLKITLAD